MLLISLSVLGGCAPVHTRVPPGEVPEQRDVSAEDERYGQQVLGQLMEKYRLDRSDFRVNRVRAVAERLARAAHADQNPWNVYVLVDDNFQNAAAERGNYVFVWTGLLKTVQSDDELATVIGHEIGHVLAGHTNPDPNQEVMRILSGVAGQVAGGVTQSQVAFGGVGDLAQMVTEQALNAFFLNPNLHSKELEADQIGLFLMADAGYDPELAIRFWDRVKRIPGFEGAPLEILSSHPTSEHRVEQLRALLPAADERYQRAIGVTRLGADQRRSSTSPDGDTFAVSRPTMPGYGTRDYSQRDSFARRTSAESGRSVWIVEASHVRVYSNPSTFEGTRGELVRDTHVVVTRELPERAPRGRWLQIENPVRGYVMSADLAPLDGR